MFEIINIFPKTIIKSSIGREISLEEKKLVDFYFSETIDNIGNKTSKNNFILDKDFLDIKLFIEKNIHNYVENIIVPKEDLQFYITQSWLNYTEPSKFHHRHNHPNSILSGVFYFNADKLYDKIFFFENNPYQQIKIILEKFNYYNSDSWWIPVHTGDLIIFPSYLHHMVELKEGDNLRTSLAFNVFVKGNLGSQEELNFLKL
jgi:uncharacterized protein (TIGR02466 family)